MNGSIVNQMQRWFGTLTGTTGIICLALAFSFSLTSGVTYPAALAQVTIFYQYATAHLSMFIPS